MGQCAGMTPDRGAFGSPNGDLPLRVPELTFPLSRPNDVRGRHHMRPATTRGSAGQAGREETYEKALAWAVAGSGDGCCPCGAGDAADLPCASVRGCTPTGLRLVG